MSETAALDNRFNEFPFFAARVSLSLFFSVNIFLFRFFLSLSRSLIN